MEKTSHRLQRLSLCRDDVICFHKTRFKFVPAFPELQRGASVETSADYISGIREARCIKIQPIARGSLALPSLCLFPLPLTRVCCSCEVTAQRPPGPSFPAPIEAWKQASNGLKAKLAQTRADFGQVFLSLAVKLQEKACLERMIWFGNFTFKLSCLFCSPCTIGEPSCEVRKETGILGCWILGGGKRGSEFYSCNDLSQSKPISVCIFVEDNWEICTGERSLVQSQKSMG